MCKQLFYFYLVNIVLLKGEYVYFEQVHDEFYNHDKTFFSLYS